MVAGLDDLPGDGRAHDRRPRRPQARARVRVGVDGRPQAGRVRAHAPVPRACRLREGPLMAEKPGNPSEGKVDAEKVEAEATEAKAAVSTEAAAEQAEATRAHADEVGGSAPQQ